MRTFVLIGSLADGAAASDALGVVVVVEGVI
jgi:hypothetical protein